MVGCSEIVDRRTEHCGVSSDPAPPAASPQDLFDQYAGTDHAVDYRELQLMLNAAFSRGISDAIIGLGHKFKARILADSPAWYRPAKVAFHFRSVTVLRFTF